MVSDLARQHQFAGYSDAENLTSSDVSRFILKLNSALTQKSSLHDGIKSGLKSTESKLLAELQDLKSELASFEEGRRINKRQIESNKTKISDLVYKLQSIRITQIDVDLFNTRLSDDQGNLDSFTSSFNPDTILTEIRRLNQEISKLEFKNTTVSEKLKVISGLGESRSRISFKNIELIKKRENFDMLLNISKSELINVCGGRVPAIENIEKEVEAILKLKLNDLKKSEDGLYEEAKELSGVETRLSMFQNQTSKLNSDLKIHADAIKQVCGDEEYHVFLEKINHELNETNEYIYIYIGLVKWMKQ